MTLLKTGLRHGAEGYVKCVALHAVALALAILLNYLYQSPSLQEIEP